MGARANVQGSGYRVPGAICPTAVRRPSTVRRRPSTAGFTLVEMLTVIVIIGILGSLITGAAIVAQRRARRATVRMEISQLEMALTRYKQDIGELPPDFANLRSPCTMTAGFPDPDPGTNEVIRVNAQDAVLRHLRKRFPRYTPQGKTTPPGYYDQFRPGNRTWRRFRDDVIANYTQADVDKFDAAAALVFWLGGLPETASGKPAGFHADVQFPFKQGLPRTEPLFDFDIARIRNVGDVPGYYANTDPDTRPYVYFRAQRLMNAAGRHEYGYISSSAFYPLSYPAYDPNNMAQDYAVPYLDEQALTSGGSTINFNAPGTTRVWRNQETFQILFAGSDGLFGTTDGFGNINATFRFSKLGQELPRTVGSNEPKPLSDGNFDNITNFTSDTIEAEMQQ